MPVNFLNTFLRGFRRRPGFAAVVVAVVALAIGLATAAFSLADAVFLQPLPFADADRLAIYCCTFPAQGEGWRDAPASPAAMREYQRAARSVEDLAIFYDQGHLNLTSGDMSTGAEHLPVTFVAGNYFPLLGAGPALGRYFTATECAEGTENPVVVASHSFWKNHLGARSNAIGSQVDLNGRHYTVVGVMPEGFRDLSNENGPPQLWLPLPMARPFLGDGFLSNYALQTFRAAVRLKPGVGFTAAQQEADAFAERLEQEQPATHHGRGIRLMPVREFFFLNSRPAVLVLACGALLVVLIAAVNLANLFLVDGLRHRHELVLRAALGADERDLARAVWSQILPPLLAGGVAGLGLATVLIALFHRAATLTLPDFAHVELSPAALLACFALLGGVVLAAASVSAARARRLDLQAAMQSASRGGGDASGNRLRFLLIAAEVAIATALLAGTGLTAKSLLQIMRADNGYNPHRLLSFQLLLDRSRLPTREQRVGFTRQLLTTLQDGPGMETATLWGPSMLSQAGWAYDVTPEGRDPHDPAAQLTVQHLHTVPGGLSALGITLERGRDFSPGALPEYPAEVIVDDELARRFWPNQDPLGRTLTLFHDPARQLVVIGVVGHVRHRGRTFNEAAGHTGDLYASYFQIANDNVCILIRHRTGQEGLVLDWVRARIAALDPQLALFNVAEMDDRLTQQERSPQFTATLFGTYSAISLLLTVVGIYGVLAFSIGQRTREFGIRIAIGATRGRVVRLVVGQGAGWIGLGMTSGLVLAVLLAPLLDGVLVNVSHQDPGVLIATAAFMALTSLAATLGPAWRAARVNPLDALRSE